MVKIIIFENGKVKLDGEGEVMFVVSFFEWFLEEVLCIYGDVVLYSNFLFCVNVVCEFVGVCGLIILWVKVFKIWMIVVNWILILNFVRWNFFVGMVIWKVVLVLVVGCIVVFKFFGEIFFSLIVFVVLVVCVGVLKGVFNIVSVFNNIF